MVTRPPLISFLEQLAPGENRAAPELEVSVALGARAQAEPQVAHALERGLAAELDAVNPLPHPFVRIDSRRLPDQVRERVAGPLVLDHGPSADDRAAQVPADALDDQPAPD